ncbi:MAG: alpha/beta hydrolase [Planctomycetota bacterium]
MSGPPSEETRQETVPVRGESVPVTTIDPPPGAATRGDALFLHGYARHPIDYADLLQEVARRGRRVVAPFLFANNGLHHPPTTFWACAALAHRTVQALRDAGRLDPGAPVFGHSTGGAVGLTLGTLDPAPPGLFAINPVQPSARRAPAMMLSSAWMNTKMGLGLAGEGHRARRVLRDSSGRFYGNWLRKPRAAVGLIGGLRAFTYERLLRWYRPHVPSDVPVRVVYGVGDEFYPSTEGLEEGLGRVFSRCDLVRLETENSHEWLMIRPEKAVDELERFLGEDAPYNPGSERSGRTRPGPR